MKLIHRYLLKELFIPFLLGLALFTGVLISHQLFDITDLIITRGFSPLALLLFLVASIPQTFYFTIPMAILMGVLMAYGRLAADMELTIMRASGVSLRSLLIPPLIAGILLTSGLLMLREYGLPVLAHFQAAQLARMETPRPPELISPGRDLVLGPYTIYTEEIEGDIMINPFLEDRSREYPLRIYARRGQWIQEADNEYILLLEEGTIHQQTEDEYRNIQFSRQTFPFQTAEFSAEVAVDIEDAASLTYLYKKMAGSREELYSLEQRIQKEDTNLERAYRRQLEETRKNTIIFHRALAIPFASFFLILVGAPFGMLARQSGKSIGFVLSLLIIFTYYMLITAGEPLAMNGWLSPSLAAWSANLFFGITGLIMLISLHIRGR